MFTVLLEDPTPVIVFGIVVEAILGWMLFQTGRGVLLWAMGGVLAVVLLGVLIERLVVTDRERVEATIDACAAAVQDNDLKTALSFIDPQAQEAQNLMRWGMGQVKFDKVKVNRCDVKIIRTTSPMTAKAELSGVISGVSSPGGMRITYPPEGTLEFRLEGERWVVINFVLKNDPRGRN